MTTLAETHRPDAVIRRTGRPWIALVAATVAVWLAIARLAQAFWSSSLEWTYVAEQSRVGAPWYYRLAGLWGGSEGSMLLFTGIVAVAVTIAARRAAPVVQGAALATAATLMVCDLTLASPFGREAVAPTVGFGLNPILEHPAMAIHPPLLYTGLAATAGASVAATIGGWNAARRWILSGLALLTAAMTLGAAWSYLEQGWGGYWGWDPVENTSLLVWIACLVAIHLAPRARPAVAVASCVAPWVLALAGAALVRSGRVPSVHAFAEQGGVGWVLIGLAVGTVAASSVAVLRANGAAGNVGGGTVRRTPGDARSVLVTLAVVAGVLVFAGTVVPVLADLAGGRTRAVRGEFFARSVGPLAIAAVPFLAVRLRRTSGWSTVAHAGAMVMLTGIGVSTFDHVEAGPVEAGATVRLAGADVHNGGVEVGAGPRRGTDAVTALVTVGGHELRPSIVVYPERGGRLAEVAVHSGPWTDTQAVLESASDDGTVLVTVHRRHGMWLVWLGAAVVTVAVFAAARASSAPGSPERREPQRAAGPIGSGL